jgi:hypothetical protein
MKKYILIVIILLLFTPIIPYENEINDGVTVIENRSVAEWVWKRYQEVKATKEKVNHVEDQSSQKP